MRAIALTLLLLLAACSHVHLSASSESRGSTSTTSSANVHVHGGGSLAALLIAGMLIAGATEDLRNPQPFPSLSVFSDWMSPRPAPPLEPGRAISEQDCTKPIALDGNLRCR